MELSELGIPHFHYTDHTSQWGYILALHMALDSHRDADSDGVCGVDVWRWSLSLVWYLCVHCASSSKKNRQPDSGPAGLDHFQGPALNGCPWRRDHRPA